VRRCGRSARRSSCRRSPAVLTGSTLIALGYGSSTPGLLAYTFGAFVAASIVLEFVRGTRARHALFRRSWPGALIELVARNRRRYGGYLVHAAILMLAIGIAGSSAYQTVRERGLHPGQSMEIAGYTLTYKQLQRRQEANAVATRAVVDVSRGGSHVTTLYPGKNVYPVEQQVSNEVSIYHDPRNLGDLFTIADQIDSKSQTLFLKVLVKPLVNLNLGGRLPVRVRGARRRWPVEDRERRTWHARRTPGRRAREPGASCEHANRRARSFPHAR